MAVLAMALLAAASVTVVVTVTADARASASRDAANDAAAAAASAEHLISELVRTIGPLKTAALLGATTKYLPTATSDMSTHWRTPPGAASCADDACWAAVFECAVTAPTLIGLDAEAATAGTRCGDATGVQVPIWTITVVGAARCDSHQQQDGVAAILETAHRECRKVSRPAQLTYEPVSLPLYTAILSDTQITPDQGDVLYDVLKTQLGDQWDRSVSLVGGTQAANVSLQVEQTGIFLNTNAAASLCEGPYTSRAASTDQIGTQTGVLDCTGLGPLVATANTRIGAVELLNHNGVALTATMIKGDACSGQQDPTHADYPDVVAWAIPGDADNPWPASRRDNRLNLFYVAEPDPSRHQAVPDVEAVDIRAVVGVGVGVGVGVWDAPVTVVTPHSVLIPSDGIPLGDDKDRVVTVISGCHIFIQPPEKGEASTTAGDHPVALEGVLLVAAGGVWSAYLDPPLITGGVCNVRSGHGETLAGLSISGAVITGWAGQTSMTNVCPVLSVQVEVPIVGFECPSTTSGPSTCARELPKRWASHETAYWPGRANGYWRQR